jgi:uncharacterized protein (TIGR03083 family)
VTDRTPTPDDVFAAAYDGVRDRLASEPLTTHGSTAVPACPGWRVSDVLSHLAGLCEDWVEHRFDGYASPEWTERQVARFAGRPIDEILLAWGSAAAAFARLPSDTFIGSPPRWAFGDAVIHEADIRGATNLGRVPPEAVTLALRGTMSRWSDVLHEAGTPGLLVHSPDGPNWSLARRDDDRRFGVVEVEAPTYELFRALAGRRTSAEVRAWHWSDDPGPFVQAGLPYPFRWSSRPMTD